MYRDAFSLFDILEIVQITLTKTKILKNAWVDKNWQDLMHVPSNDEILLFLLNFSKM